MNTLSTHLLFTWANLTVYYKIQFGKTKKYYFIEYLLDKLIVNELLQSGMKNTWSKGYIPDNCCGSFDFRGLDKPVIGRLTYPITFPLVELEEKPSFALLFGFPWALHNR